MREDASHHAGGLMNISSRWLYLPLMIAILLMLPRICSAEFGFFDDASVLIKSQQLIRGDWNQLLEPGSGRFRPFYWLYPTIIYSLAHLRSGWFFAGNLLLLIGTTAGIMILSKRLTDSRFIGFWSGIFFVLSGPVIENYYTLSKGEPLQVAWILIALLTLCEWRRMASRRSKAAILALLTLWTFLSIISKETSLVMVPISIAWFLGTLIYGKYTQEETNWKQLRAYMLSTFAAAGIYLLLRFVLLPVNTPSDGYASNYTLDISRILSAARQWERWIRRDFFYLTPLCILPIISIVRTRRLNHGKVIFETLVWMAAWAFVFLPWVFQVEYYMLPFAVGSSVLGGILLYQTLEIAKRGGKLTRLLALICVIAAAFFFIVTLPNNLTNARLQLTVDENNAAMLSFVVDELPTNSTLFINIQEPNQYVDDIKLWLAEIMGRADLHVEHYQFQTFRSSNGQNPYYYVASPYLDNQYYRSVRLGVGEASSKTWDESMLSFVGESADVIFETLGGYRLSIVDIRLGCLIVDEPAYCDIPTVPIDDRILTYGWRIYRIPYAQGQ